MTTTTARIALLTFVVASWLPSTAASQAPAAAAVPELVILNPRDSSSSTEREFVNVMGRVPPGCSVRVAGVDAQVFGTGIFVRDRVPLEMGPNTIRIEAVRGTGGVAVHVVEVERRSPPVPARLPPDHLVIDRATIEPASARRLRPGELLEVSFRATAGMIAESRLAGGRWQRMEEGVDPKTGEPSGSYLGYLSIIGGRNSGPRPVQVRLKASPRASVRGPRTVNLESAGMVGDWDPAERLFAVSEGGAALTWGLHEVRLGGPNLAELGAGTVLRVTGQLGDFYRVQLAPDTEAWVGVKSVVPAPPATRIPNLVFTSLSVSGDEAGDTVAIPYTSPVPFAVASAEGADGRAGIDVDIYGAHNAATWITHRASASVVREVRVEQPTAGRIRVRIVIGDGRLWGYKVEQAPASLRIIVRRPPPPSSSPVWPLRGLTIALEAGHGGPGNVGARGPTGSLEKDVNRWTVEELQAELERAGARVVIVRPGDGNPPLPERARLVTESGAHIFISMHANAGGTENGYLRVGGTSTYYKQAFCRELSEAVHRRLLQTTGLADFGNVGAFNYTPLRLITWVPSILVEQAFMSNPSDEAYLLDPARRARTVLAVRLGIEDFLAGR